MVSGSSFDLKRLVDILTRETIRTGTNHRFTDWGVCTDKNGEPILLEDGAPARRKEDFICKLNYEKIKLHEIESNEFLSFAKKDIEENSDRGRVNALSNAKRAIECRMDELLILWNLKYFSSQLAWNLPYKMQVLQTLGVPAPAVLRNIITQKRNLLEHEYVKPKDQKEIQNIVDIADLYLTATDGYTKKGYLSSAIITCTTWLEKARDKNSTTQIRVSMKYELMFDLKNEKQTVREWLEVGERLINNKTGSISEKNYDSAPELSKKGDILAFRDCAVEDVRELMILLREKGTD